MNCAFDKEKLSGYYDGELDTAEKAEVERHIASCSECLRELGELKSSALLVKELPRLRAPRSIAEGVAREIQTAGKVHQFAKVRRGVLWAATAAAGIFVVLNVAYFLRAERPAGDPAVVAKPTSIASVPPPAAEPAPLVKAEEPLRRAAPSAERERQFAAEDRKKDPAESPLEEAKKLDEKSRPAQPEPSRPLPVPAPEPKPAAARGAEPNKPADLPAPPPAPPAVKPVVSAPAPGALAGKGDARPAVEAPAEKSAAPKAEPMAKDADVKAKRTADLQGEAPPTHLTLASTQLAKARPVMDETLKKMGVKVPSAAPTAPLKSMAGKSGPAETTLILELTDSQIARLRQELEKSGHSRLVAASPGDPVLQQFGDSGLYRATRKDVASGGAGGGVKKAAEAPKADAAKPEGAKTGAAETKEADREKDGKEAGEPFKSNLEGAAADKSQEPKRKIVLHLLDVPFMPDQQPAPDPVKK
jgi:hypothetical protein